MLENKTNHQEIDRNCNCINGYWCKILLNSQQYKKVE